MVEGEFTEYSERTASVKHQRAIDNVAKSIRLLDDYLGDSSKFTHPIFLGCLFELLVAGTITLFLNKGLTLIFILLQLLDLGPGFIILMAWIIHELGILGMGISIRILFLGISNSLKSNVVMDD